MGGHAIFSIDNDQRRSFIDLSHNAEFSTSIMMWYPETAFALDPVKSGYQLTLEYSFEIDGLPSIPQLPPLADAACLGERVRILLSRWKNGEYQTPFPPMMVHTLSDITDGLRRILLPVAEELGFIVCTAQAKLHLTGTGDDSQGQYNQRKQRGGFASGGDEEGFAPPMGTVSSRKISVTLRDCVSGEDADFQPLGNSEIDVYDECLASNFFNVEKDKPDDAKYDGFGDQIVCRSLVGMLGH